MKIRRTTEMSFTDGLNKSVLDFFPDATPARDLRNSVSTVLLCALLTVLSGCVTPPTPRMARAAVLPPPAATTAEDDSKSIENSAPPRIPPSIQKGTGQTIDTAVASTPLPGVSKEVAGNETTFNFEGESLNAVVKAILGDLLQQNYVIAPGVHGTVTLSTPTAVNSSQALSLLEMVLGWNNARMIWADGRYNIVPGDQALLTGNLAPRTGPIGNVRGYEVRAVPLHFISATEMQKLLTPYARANAIVDADAARNLIVLAGTKDELENYLRTIQIFDVDWLAGMSVGVYPLQQTDAVHMVASLEAAFGANSKTPVAGMFRFMPLEGINAVLVITPQPSYLTEIQTWIDRLDQGDGQTARLYVYEVKNVKASDLSTQIGTLFGIQVQQPTPAPSTVPGLEPVDISSYGSGKGGQASPPLASVQSGSNTSRAGNASSGANVSQGNGSGVSITSVEDSNSILVRATPAQWESIRRAIDRLDTMPLQVHIEAQVIEVELQGDLSYGVSWYLKNGISQFDPNLGAIAQTRTAFGPVGATLVPSPGTSTVPAGLTFAYLAKDALAVIQALDTVTNLRILSAPSLVVRNNVEADFDSGTQIPIASTILSPGFAGTTTPTSGSTSNGSTSTTDTFSQVQYIQTGVSLKVKPRAASNGMVFMDITQEVSSPQSTAASVGGNVPIDDRKLKTSVAVQSGETVLLAGLIKETKGTGASGLPYLDRLPVVGGLFGTKSVTNEREEVLVLITPTIIRNPADARKVTDDYGARFKALQPLRKPDAKIK
jgi:general secretion pathway protein D